MMRTRLLTLLLAGLALVTGSACTDSEPDVPGQEANSETRRDSDAGPRHVLLIVIDTLRADHLGCYGYSRKGISPSIDTLAKRGARFDRAIAQSSWTSPSMITMMTGHRLANRRLGVPDEAPTLAELFKDAGYTTGAFVSNPLLTVKNGFRRGFDAWTQDNTLQKIDAVVQWLVDHKHEDTFTWVHFTDPHDPYKPPKALRSGTLAPLSPETNAVIDATAEARGYGDVEDAKRAIAKQIGLYDDEIQSVDRKVRTLVTTLQKNGNLDNSVVVLTADHGECLWMRVESDSLVKQNQENQDWPDDLQHRMKQRHGEFLYQELVRVPLIITAPSIARRTVIDGIAESVNLGASILDLAGVSVEEGLLQGKSFFDDSVLDDGGYSMTRYGESFWSDDNWKLVLPTVMGTTALDWSTELYDLNADPEERNNLAQAMPEKVAELRAKIVARRESVKVFDGKNWESQQEANLKALIELGYIEMIDGEDQQGGHQHGEAHETAEGPGEAGETPADSGAESSPDSE